VPSVFASCVFFGVAAGGLYPVGFAWLLEGMPESQYGYASGAFARAYGLGSLVGPLACGWLAESFGARGLFGAIAGAGLLSALVVLLTRATGGKRGKP
jgi:MFS family permease